MQESLHSKKGNSSEEEQFQTPGQAGVNQLKSSLAGEDLEVRAASKLTMRHQCALGAKKADSLQSCIRQSAASRLREMNSPCPVALLSPGEKYLQ